MRRKMVMLSSRWALLEGPTTSILVVICLVLLLSVPIVTAQDATDDLEPATAVLFPWFTEALGVLVFFILTRYCTAIPFTAIMFLLGMFMGIGVSRLENRSDLSESIYQWSNINWHVLLLVFLPGTVFHDSFGMNVHLFQTCFSQILVYAFPMVLAGTCLTALVAFYIFPYNWSWNLAMTFGSILSATDPVAVSALLDEVGAPPRLSMQISGESLLNDGSAMTFYLIFSALFLFELGLPGGEDLSVAKGFGMFFRAALGGTALGIAFGLGLLLLLFLLNRRLDQSENVVQVVATITVAYLAYYVGDVVCDSSGVITVVFTGITAKAFGSHMINNQELMDAFWEIVNQLLDTALFALGGTVWGFVISNSDLRDGEFKGKDWGYLILLYVLLNAIRYVCLAVFYPVSAHIGMGTNWRECCFSGFSGLRGTVGISLALSLDSQLRDGTDDQAERALTNTLFGMVGGVALFTLVINGTFCGPVLKALGLATSPEVRNKLVQSYDGHLDQEYVDIIIQQLADPRFRRVNYHVVSDHLTFFKSLTAEQFRAGLQRYKNSVAPDDYQEPQVDNILAYLDAKDGGDSKADIQSNEDPWSLFENQVNEAIQRPAPKEEATTSKESTTKASSKGADDDKPEEAVEAGSTDDKPEKPMDNPDIEEAVPTEEDVDDAPMVKELRKTFIELLRSSYQVQTDEGELDGRTGFVDFVLNQSLEYANDAVSMGKPLSDWEMAEKVNNMWIDRWIDKGDRSLRSWLKKLPKGCKTCWKTQEDKKLRIEVFQALAFLEAHRLANARFEKEFSFPTYTKQKKLVLDESREQVLQAVKVLQSYDQNDVELVVSYLLCTIVLNKAAKVIEKANAEGILKNKEANSHLTDYGKKLQEVHERLVDDQ